MPTWCKPAAISFGIKIFLINFASGTDGSRMHRKHSKNKMNNIPTMKEASVEAQVLRRVRDLILIFSGEMMLEDSEAMWLMYNLVRIEEMVADSDSVPASAPSPNRYFGIEDSGEDSDTEYDVYLKQVADGVSEPLQEFDAPEG